MNKQSVDFNRKIIEDVLKPLEELTGYPPYYFMVAAYQERLSQIVIKFDYPKDDSGHMLAVSNSIDVEWNK